MSAMQRLTSTQNPLVREARQLSTRKGRQRQGLFLCEGEHMVGEALATCPQAVAALFVQEDRQEAYGPLLTQAAAQGSALFAVPPHVLEALSQVKTPQGIAATVAPPRPAPLSGLGNRVLLLEGVQDPGNVGTMLRTLDAAGFTGCALAGDCADPYGPKALRASMGSIFRVPLCFAGQAETEGFIPPKTVDTTDIGSGERKGYAPGLPSVLALRALEYAVIATLLDGQPFYSHPPLPQKLCLIIGNEGAGIATATAAAATHRFALPMRGGAESLNAAIAAAVMMYDLVNRG